MKLVGPTEAAESLGITRQALARLAKEPDCPVERAGSGTNRFRWPDLNLWYMARKVSEATRNDTPADLEEARTRREAALAEQEELKLAKMRGELMTVAHGQREIGNAYARVSAKLKNLPTKLAPLLVGCEDEAEVLRRVQPVVGEAMDELYRAEDITDEEEAAA